MWCVTQDKIFVVDASSSGGSAAVASSSPSGSGSSKKTKESATVLQKLIFYDKHQMPYSLAYALKINNKFSSKNSSGKGGAAGVAEESGTVWVGPKTKGHLMAWDVATCTSEEIVLDWSFVEGEDDLDGPSDHGDKDVVDSIRSRWNSRKSKKSTNGGGGNKGTVNNTRSADDSKHQESSKHLEVCCMVSMMGSVWIGNRDGKVLIVNPDTRQVERVLQAHTDSVRSMCLTREGHVVTGSSSQEGKVCVWNAMYDFDIVDGKRRKRLRDRRGAVGPHHNLSKRMQAEYEFVDKDALPTPADLGL